ncbi:MAG: BON domain-containing protein [Desulfobacteraceae bacterium]|nr:MAG: BON domain-containing protein [Desulfobacteraceae bacterium]
MKKTMYQSVWIVAVAVLFIINGPVFASDMDDRIESSALESHVFKTFLKDDDVKIESEEGVVTLTGTVNEKDHKTLAEETVLNLPGVKSVDNQMEFEGKVSSEDSDPWLITKVKSTLLFHRNVSATGTEVLAEDGTVTLRGEAASQAQKDLTTEYVKDVEGVKKVKNEMTVLAAVQKPVGKKIGEKMDVVIESIDDASITAMVKSTLLYHRSTSTLKTTVETKDGVVSLGGKAGNATVRDLTTKIVNDVHGVNKVINNMTV